MAGCTCGWLSHTSCNLGSGGGKEPRLSLPQAQVGSVYLVALPRLLLDHQEYGDWTARTRCSLEMGQQMTQTMSREVDGLLWMESLLALLLVMGWSGAWEPTENSFTGRYILPGRSSLCFQVWD